MGRGGRGRRGKIRGTILVNRILETTYKTFNFLTSSLSLSLFVSLSLSSLPMLALSLRSSLSRSLSNIYLVNMQGKVYCTYMRACAGRGGAYCVCVCVCVCVCICTCTCIHIPENVKVCGCECVHVDTQICRTSWRIFSPNSCVCV